MYNRYQVQEKACSKDTIGFGFTLKLIEKFEQVFN